MNSVRVVVCSLAILLISSDLCGQLVTKPDNASIWVKGRSETINWTKESFVGNVAITLWKGSTKVADISTGTPNDESFNWTVSTSLTAGNNYRVAVGFLEAGYGRGYSEYFTISDPSSSLPTVTTKAASAIEDNGAVLNGTINPNGAATSYTFDYGLTTAYGKSVSSTSNITGTTSQSVYKFVSGLSPQTTYHFRLSATNAAGTSYGSDRQFTTATSWPTAVTGAATNLASSEATLVGTVTPNGRTSSAYFEFGLTASYGATTPVQSLGGGTSSINVEQALTGLSPNTTYHFRIVATSSGGTGYGNDQTFSTPALAGGAITIQLSNIPGGLSTIPGANGWVRLFESAGVQIGTEQATDASGRATFSDIQPGSGYYVTAGHTPSLPSPFGREYWGKSEGVTVATGGVTTLGLTRNQPYVSSYRVLTENTNEDVTGKTVFPGTVLRIEIQITNPNAASQQVRPRIVIDRDKGGSYDVDYEPTTYQSIAAYGGTVVNTALTYKPEGLGDYSVAVGVKTQVNGDPVLTDGWSWPERASFSIWPLRIEEHDLGSIGTREPLLLVHGWNSKGTPQEDTWDGLIAHYMANTSLQNRFKLFVVRYLSNVVGVYDLGHALRINLDEMSVRIPDFGGKQMSVVAHSMGGLITREFMRQPRLSGPFANQKGGERIRRVITLGTPHHGSPLSNGEIRRSVTDWDVDLGALIDDGLYSAFSGGPQSTEVNRSDLRWDNFDNLFDYTNYPTEQNSALMSLNSDVAYDNKIVAYVGSVAPGTFEHGILYTRSSYALWSAFKMYGDAVVPLASASFEGHGILGTRSFADYDHSELSRGKSGPSDPLFSAIAADLLANTVTTHSITLAANPPAGGLVTGGGVYNSGSNATVVAVSNSGYAFNNWTEGSSVVSNDASFSFIVSATRSLVANFSVIAKPLSPTLSSPSNGASNVSTSPTLSWGSVSGATSYGVQISASSSFASFVVDQSGLTSTSYTASGLSNGTTYYWRVNAANAGGTSAWSSARSFSTVVATPLSPTLSSPSNGASNVSTSPTLSWGSVSGATSYGVQISASSSFASFVVDQSGLTSTSYTASGLSNGTRYYWRVNAANAGGTSAWSSARSFSTVVSTSVFAMGGIPDSYALSPNFPNPFNPSTSMRFSVPVRSEVRITLYSLVGERVTVLVNDEYDPGVFETSWLANVPSGTYLVQFVATPRNGGVPFRLSQKMILIQ
jgi:pimeloyl-ACP methyl ester carboxylesterase